VGVEAARPVRCGLEEARALAQAIIQAAAPPRGISCLLVRPARPEADLWWMRPGDDAIRFVVHRRQPEASVPSLPTVRI